jgi:hypothetical protein
MISIVENIFFKSPEEKARIAQAKMQEAVYKQTIRDGVTNYHKNQDTYETLGKGTGEDRDQIVSRTADILYDKSNYKKHVEAIRKGEKFDWPKKQKVIRRF